MANIYFFSGPCGCGKSTLMKIIVGELEPDAGYVEVGPTVRIGYFSQENEKLDATMRVIDYIKETAEFVKQAFEMENMIVDVACDGQAGLDQFFKQEYDLVIYSDPDVIFRKSVSDIENYVEQDPGLYASEEKIQISTDGWVKWVIKKFNKTKYFNCGFLVLNTEIPDYSEEIYKKINKLLGQYNYCPEQNYMNYYYEVKPLKSEHNYLWCNPLIHDPISVHYYNSLKPYNIKEVQHSDLLFDEKNYMKISYFFNDYFKYEIK